MVLDLPIERNKDLLLVQKSVLGRLGANAPFTSRKRIIKLVCIEPAPRFYVSRDEASRVISKIENGLGIKRKEGLRAEMYCELFSVYSRIKAQNPKLERMQIIDIAVMEPASNFFLKEAYVQYLLNRA